MKKSVLVGLIIFVVLLADQTLKIWVKTHLAYGEAIPLFGLEKAQILFVENPGMAFGMQIAGDYGKLLLSVFRLVAVGFLGYFLIKLIKANAERGLLISFSMILAGAIGNILDSAFYGLIFSESGRHGSVAEMFPANGGYDTFLHGKVVDMLYFPLAEGYFPDWMPFLGGEAYLFFRPVFNIADVSISVGVISILLFQRHFFNPTKEEGETNTDESAIAEKVSDTASPLSPDTKDTPITGDSQNDPNDSLEEE